MPKSVFMYEDDFERKVFEFLDALRESGVTNMFGAVPYILDEFDIERSRARTHLTDWMRTFSQRHPQ